MRISDWSSDVCSSDLLTGGKASGYDILDHQDLLSFLQCKAPPQLEHAFRPFQENCLYAQRAAHFMANDDAPHGGRQNYIAVGPDFTGKLLRQRPGGAACALRFTQHERDCQLIGAALTPTEIGRA